MPEGHTIHRLADDHNAWLGGQVLHISSPQGRFAKSAALLDGSKLSRVDAYGKHLLYHFARPKSKSKRTKTNTLHVHLGLFGKYRVHDNPAPPPRGAVRVRFVGDDRTVDLNGPNQCEVLSDEEADALIARIGADPLRDDAKPATAFARIHGSRAPIGLLLMDQSIISGIGNIYRSEILHLLGVHPRVPGNEITRKQWNAIWKLAVKLLRLGVKHNRIITIDEKSLPKNIARVPRKKLFRIFKKAECPICGSNIEMITLGSRKVFLCPTCQLAPVVVK